MGKLNDDLEVARGLYHSCGDGGQIGATWALISVIDFLVDIDAPKHLLEPLGDLAHSLVALQDGKRPPLLKRATANKGRPGDLDTDRNAKVWAAVAMELYMQGGRDRQAAAKRVAMKIADWRIAKVNGSVSWHTVARWRDDLDDPNSPEEFADTYRTTMAYFEEHHVETPPDQMADHLLNLRPPYQPRISK